MFPQRRAEPRIAHTRVPLEQSFKSACVVCSEFYSKKKAEGEALQWDKFVKRTKMVCGYCSENSGKQIPCYLCKEHFDTFHDTP